MRLGPAAAAVASVAVAGAGAVAGARLEWSLLRQLEEDEGLGR